MTPEDLIGKTITGAKIQQLIGYDDTGYLLLSFSDGTKAIIYGGFSDSYTGESIDEYPTRIGITDKGFEKLQNIVE